MNTACNDRLTRTPVFVTLLLITTVALIITACVNVEVINLAETSARVRITLPDTPSGYTRFIRAGESTSTFSEYGGTVTVTVLPDEEYRELVMGLRNEISRRLFEDRETLTATQVSQLTERLNEVDKMMDDFGREGASCSVKASDYAHVTALLTWDTSAANWSLSCSVQNEES